MFNKFINSHWVLVCWDWGGGVDYVSMECVSIPHTLVCLLTPRSFIPKQKIPVYQSSPASGRSVPLCTILKQPQNMKKKNLYKTSWCDVDCSQITAAIKWTVTKLYINCWRTWPALKTWAIAALTASNGGCEIYTTSIISNPPFEPVFLSTGYESAIISFTLCVTINFTALRNRMVSGDISNQ